MYFKLFKLHSRGERSLIAADDFIIGYERGAAEKPPLSTPGRTAGSAQNASGCDS